MSDTSAHEEHAPEVIAPDPGTALMPIQAGVVVWTRRQLLAAAGFHEVRDTTLAIERIRKGIRSKVWKEAVRCAEVMLEVADVRKPRDGEAGSELGRVRAIEITVVESGRAEAESDTHGVEIRAGGSDGSEA